MIRLLVLLVLLVLAAIGFGWLGDQPGDVAVTFNGARYEMSLLVAACLLIAVALGLMAIVWLLRFVLLAPSRIARASRARRRERALDALSRGFVAAGAGDLRAAQKAHAVVEKGLAGSPLSLLLQAQTAQLAGNRDATRQTFARLAEKPETRALGLRGLHLEARRAGDAEAAHHYAQEAHKIAPVAWAGSAVLEHHASNRDWAQALGAVEANASRRLIDRPTADRQRAVLKTAIALELGDAKADEALRLSREAAGMAPDLAPAVTLAGRLLARRGDLRQAAKLIETAWKSAPHPDLARVYVDLRPGDSAADRLARARTLARLAPDDPESALCVARAAIATRDFPLARQTMAPLVDANAESRPTVRVCLMMADIEEAENGPTGLAREWLARASRAPRDKAWIADGIISDTWEPASPATGKLDAFRWATPTEQIAAGPWVPPSPEDFHSAAIIEAPAPAAVIPPPARAQATPQASMPPPDDPGPRRDRSAA